MVGKVIKKFALEEPMMILTRTYCSTTEMEKPWNLIKTKKFPFPLYSYTTNKLLNFEISQREFGKED